MEKKKYKDLDANEKWIKDAISQKWISIISLSAFFGIGLWMVLTPEGFEHASVEKSTVYLLKEIWSLETGVIILILSFPFIILTILRIKTMKGLVWVKQDSGYYLYENLDRISGMQALYDGNDMIVFETKNNVVYNFPNYEKTKVNKFKKAILDNRFNCMDAFWSGTDGGFFLYYKGIRALNLTSEYRGDDLIVTAGDLAKKFRLKDYKSNLDNRIRKANRY